MIRYEKQEARSKKQEYKSLKAPLNKGGWGDLSQATKDAALRSKSPPSPPLLRGEIKTGGVDG